MNTVWKEEDGQRYLFVESTEEGAAFEEEMAAGIRHENCLCLRLGYEAGRRGYYYELSELLPLEEYLSKGSLHAEKISDMILQLSGAAGAVKAYMLSENALLLDPAYVMAESKNGQLRFCVLPRNKRPPMEMEEFCRLLLKKADAGDPATLRLAYALFQASMQADLRLETLTGLLLDCKNQEAGDTESEAYRRLGKEKDRDSFVMREDTEALPLFREALSVETLSEEAERGSNRDSKAGYFKKELVRNRFLPGRKEEKKHQEKEREPLRKESLFETEEAQEQTRGGTYKNGGARMKAAASILILSAGYAAVFFLRGKEAALRFLPAYAILCISMILFFAVGYAEQRWSAHSSQPKGKRSFHFFGLKQKEQNREMPYLLPMDEALPEIEIPYTPFMIGRDEGMSDFTLKGKDISPLHLKIEEEEGGYTATDLRTQEGSLLNGRRMPKGQPVALGNGDELVLGTKAFYFRI